ncbi:hypothetical protein HDU97_003317 [Phlyctochytrium planicorne]|nr:hypothetical protein HDU97_003317 [Phlyctochytrium planicorne]
MLDFSSPIKDFPLAGVLPKEETQASLFLEQNPTHDGRGTIIAILDTGVDPKAVGLQKTSTGLPKIVDLIDCTGQGDVPCTKVVEATVTADGTLTLPGLTGRTLTIPSSWKLPPDGKYRLGWTSTNALFPEPVVEELKKERKRKFEIEHHKLLTDVQNQIQQHEKEVPSPSDAQTSQRNDLKARLEALKEQMQSFAEPGLLFDCVVFFDGDKWRAAIDVNESGNLADAPLLTNFRDEHQSSSFGDDSMLNFSVNIFDNGEMLSIVTTSGSHGTHVAAIAAANHPNDPRQNGVAPGAQVISLKIGDVRVKGMETGTGLVRAAIELARLKADVANISFGEAIMTPNYGRFIEILRDDAVNKAGCIVLSSAGNSGPTLSTVGAPGGTTSSIVSVGAFATPAMHEAMYNLLENPGETPTNWSSRGPTSDGATGVDIYAPGAAITAVPQFTRSSALFMNGTSMASPNAAGCYAILISGLKQQKIPYTPYRVTAAIKNSARNFGDIFSVGFIQVLAAWNHLTKVPALKHNLDVFYQISFPQRNNARGLYLRENPENSTKQTFRVSIGPKFFNDLDPSQNSKKIEFETQIALVGTQHWVSAPEFVMICSDGRSFLIGVDPTNLSPGFHYAEILGIDTNQRQAGPLFRIPITVCKTESDTVTDGNSRFVFPKLHLTPGNIIRKYITAPHTANFAGLWLSVGEQNQLNIG